MKRTILIAAVFLGLSFPALAEAQSSLESFHQQLDALGLKSHRTPPASPGLGSLFTTPQRRHRNTIEDILRENQQRQRQQEDVHEKWMRGLEERARERERRIPEETERTTIWGMRNYYSECAKYNRHCLNVLRSLGDQ